MKKYLGITILSLSILANFGIAYASFPSTFTNFVNNQTIIDAPWLNSIEQLIGTSITSTSTGDTITAELRGTATSSIRSASSSIKVLTDFQGNLYVTSTVSGIATSSPIYLGGVPYMVDSSTMRTSLNIIYNATSGVLTIGTSTITNLTATNASSGALDVTNRISGATLLISGQSSLQAVSGTSAGFSSNSYNLGNLSIGTTTSAYRLYAATSTPIFLINDSGQISLNSTTTSIQAGSTVFPADVSIHNSAGTTLSSELQLFKHSTALGQGNGVNLLFARSQGTMGAPLVVTNGNYAFSIVGLGYDGLSAYQQATRIDSMFEGTPSSTQMAGRIVFRTTPNSATTTQERMRIDSSGYVTIGTSTPSNLVGVGTSTNFFQLNSTTSQTIVVNVSSTGALDVSNRLSFGNASSSGGVTAGTLQITGHTSLQTATTTQIDVSTGLRFTGFAALKCLHTDANGNATTTANDCGTGTGGGASSTPIVLDSNNVSLPDTNGATPQRATTTATNIAAGFSFSALMFPSSTASTTASWGPYIINQGVWNGEFTQTTSSPVATANAASFKLSVATTTGNGSSSIPNLTFFSCGIINVGYNTTTPDIVVHKSLTCNDTTSTSPILTYFALERMPASGTDEMALIKSFIW